MKSFLLYAMMGVFFCGSLCEAASNAGGEPAAIRPAKRKTLKVVKLRWDDNAQSIKDKFSNKNDRLISLNLSDNFYHWKELKKYLKNVKKVSINLYHPLSMRDFKDFQSFIEALAKAPGVLSMFSLQKTPAPISVTTLEISTGSSERKPKDELLQQIATVLHQINGLEGLTTLTLGSYLKPEGYKALASVLWCLCSLKVIKITDHSLRENGIEGLKALIIAASALPNFERFEFGSQLPDNDKFREFLTEWGFQKNGLLLEKIRQKIKKGD